MFPIKEIIKLDDGRTWRATFNTRATFKNRWFRWRTEAVHDGQDVQIDTVSLCPCSMSMGVSHIFGLPSVKSSHNTSNTVSTTSDAISDGPALHRVGPSST